MSKNYLELKKSFPELFEKKESLSPIFLSAPVEDFKAELQLTIRKLGSVNIFV
jgi:hypothetical protein